jgi:DNA repair protein RadA/Sms
LLNISKKTNIPIFLIGHVTKQGAIAGPKVLEHIVDTVLYLEGDKQHDFRILRTSKNRFGPTDEVGIFQMTDKGMKSVLNPADIFLQEDGEKNPKPGSAIVCSMQGIRPMLVEIQALVVNTQLAIPRRVASGINQKKLQVLVAVLQKKLGLPLHQYDIFVNVAGGLKLREPAIDLGICMAVASSLKNKPLLKNSVCIGEVGLLGEIRKVSFMDKRIKEAKKMGYKIIIGDRQIDLRQMLKFLK